MHLKNLFILVLISLLTSCGSDAQPTRITDYPSLEEVATHIGSRVDLNYPGQNQHYYSLSRRPEGWFVQEEDMEGNIVKAQLYWSLAARQYQEVKLSGAERPMTGNKPNQSYIRNFSNGFNNNLFFNYPNWAEDVIAVLEPLSSPGDSALYHLARAYDGMASSYLAPGVQNRHDKQKWANEDRTEIKSSSADSGKYFVRKSIETYDKLVKQNPKFQTIVGPVKIKAANENMYAWLELAILNRAAEGAEFLKADLYDGAVLSLAKSILNSCPQNAILFVNGDNDTYPLLWAQQKLGYRKDVSVVNLSLINLARYVHYLRELAQGSQRIAFVRPMQWYYDNFKEGYVPMIKSPVPVPATAPLPQEGMGGFVKVETLPVKGRGGPSPYLLNQDAAVIDIIAANWGTRPVCFSVTVPSSNFIGLSDLLWQRGMVMQLLAGKGQSGTFQSVMMENQHVQTVLNEYDFSFTGSGNEKGLFVDDPGIMGLVFTCVTAAQLAAMQQDEASVKRICEKVTMIFKGYPNDQSYMTEWMLSQACRAGNYAELAGEWESLCLAHLREQVENIESLPADDRENRVSRYRHILENMMRNGSGRNKGEAEALLQKL